MVHLRAILALAATTLLLAGCGSTVPPGTTAAGPAQQAGPTTQGLGQAAEGALGVAPDGSQQAPGSSGSSPSVGSETLPAATGGEGTVAPQGPPASSGSSARGNPPTGPLKFGLLTVKDAGAAVGAIGGNNNNTGSEGDWARAMVRHLNKNGGIAGRQLKPVEYEIDPQSTNYEVELSAACEFFTRDNKVSLVVSQSGFLWSASYQACLAKAGVGHLLLSGAYGDAQQLRQFPGLYNVNGPTPERRTRGLLQGLNASGYLTSKNKIGVLVEDCTENQRTYANTLVPLATRMGLNVRRRDVGCLRGFGDVGAFQAQVQAAVLPFRTDGVDRVIYLSAWEGLMMLFFENQSNSQGYAPSYALTSNSIPALNPGNYSGPQLARMRGMGWSPVSDTTAGPPKQQLQRCEAAGREAELQVSTATDRTYMAQSCELFFILKAALEAVGGRDDRISLSTGLAAASKSYTSVLQVGGRINLGGERRDAPTKMAEYAYVASCACFRYAAAPRPLD